jgi:hypothetical protein
VAWDTVAVAVVGIVSNVGLSLGMLRLQSRHNRLDYARTARREPYARFGGEASAMRFELDQLWLDRRPSEQVALRADELMRTLELARVDIDLVGSPPVRSWAYRMSLVLRGLADAVIAGDADEIARLAAKLHDARAEWVQAARDELGVSSFSTERPAPGSRSADHNAWLESAASDSGYRNLSSAVRAGSSSEVGEEGVEAGEAVADAFVHAGGDEGVAGGE